jgi:hypothetical protein
MKSLLTATVITLGMTGNVMSQDRIRITSNWGVVVAELADNAATRELSAMLPLTIKMGDHLRQEKTGTLPSALPDLPRQRDFTAGTLGLWGGRDFVIYYRSGSVPPPGIIILGQVEGDVSIFDQPGDITVEVSRLE